MVKKEKGMTLIELLIAIVIIGVIAGIAYPSYLYFIKKARLEEAKSALIQDQKYMTKYYAKNYRFKRTSTRWPKLPITSVEYFDIKFTSSARGEKFEGYRLRAIPKKSYTSENRYLEVDHGQSVKLCTKNGRKIRCTTW